MTNLLWQPLCQIPPKKITRAHRNSFLFLQLRGATPPKNLEATDWGTAERSSHKGKPPGLRLGVEMAPRVGLEPTT